MGGCFSGVYGKVLWRWVWAGKCESQGGVKGGKGERDGEKGV